MENWLTVSELSKATEIPDSTIRRYITKFEAYFRWDERGKGKKYHPETIEVLKRISLLYSEGYQVLEIDDILAKYFPMTVDDKKVPPFNHHISTTQIQQQFQEFILNQEQFNQQLLKQLEKQQEYIKNSIDRRDQDLLQTLSSLQESRKEIAATKTKKWWKLWG